MKFNEGYLFENGIVVPKEMNYKTCLIFGEHTISSGDQVCLWTIKDATIVGKLYKIDEYCILVEISRDSAVRVNTYDIKEIAKKIDGKWVIMEVKE